MKGPNSGLRAVAPCHLHAGQALVVVCAALSGFSAATSAQTRRLDLTTVLDSAGGLVAGTSFGRVIGSGETFSGVHDGYGVQLFVGIPFVVIDELRLGAAWNTHGDEVDEDPVVFKGAYLETYRTLARWRVCDLRVAPRLTWMQETRAMYPTELDAFGFGAVLGARTRMGGRFSLESTVGLTGMSFGTAAFNDPDGIAPAWMWEFRVATAFRVW